MKTTPRSPFLLLAVVFVSIIAASLPNPGQTQEYSVSTFSADVTPPLDHPLLAGWRTSAKKIKDPLSAKGIVLWGPDKPLVICAIDWCELRNDAYDAWRDALAKAVNTTREKVLVHCIHQHDTPYADLEAQRLLTEHGYPGEMFDPEFFHQSVARVAAAAKKSVVKKIPVSHIGTGEAKVNEVACNRRVESGGKIRFNRYSFTRDLRVRNADEGEIDPMIKMISFYNGDRAAVSISCYATHPMSYYGRGEVSYDFTGMARERRQKDHPEVFQIYMTGCSGDITAAKFNTGNDTGRERLADNLYLGMADAWKATERAPLKQINFRVGTLVFDPRTTGNFDPQKAKQILSNKDSSAHARSEAAMTLSWRKRLDAGQPVDVPMIDLGAAQIVLLPGESFVRYQLEAQKIRPGGFVMTPGFGECAPGYIPSDQAEKEGFVKEHGYDWVAPMPEQKMLKALREVLQN